MVLRTTFCLLLGVFVLAGCDQAEEQAKKAADKGTSAVDKLKEAAGNFKVGDVDLSKDLTGWIDGLQESLGSITDADSAKAALPKLEEANTQLDGLLGMTDKLPASAKGMFAGVIKNALDGLKDKVEKVTGIPGVGEIVKPILDGIVEKLSKAAQT